MLPPVFEQLSFSLTSQPGAVTSSLGWGLRVAHAPIRQQKSQPATPMTQHASAFSQHASAF